MLTTTARWILVMGALSLIVFFVAYSPTIKETALVTISVGLGAAMVFFGGRSRDTDVDYRGIVERIPAVPYIDKADDKSTTTYVAPQIKKLLGFTQEEWLRKPGTWIDRTHPEDRERVLAEHDRATLEESEFACVYRMITKDGKSVWVKDDALLFEDHDGEKWQGLLVDMTSEKAAQRERARLESLLSQTQKMEALGQLAGGVAHDFNNLLAIIGNYTRCALDDLDPAHPIRDDLAEVLSATDRGTLLVSELLTMARKEPGKRTPAVLNELVLDLKGLLANAVQEDVAIELDLTHMDTTVMIDPPRIERVLLNMAVNARDAMPHGGKLRISTILEAVANGELEHLGLSDGTYVVMRVTDTGVGMTEEVQRRVFEPFFTTKSSGDGTGLGLAMAHGIIRDSNGAISIDSKVGAGTTLTIHLPWSPISVNGTSTPSAV